MVDNIFSTQNFTTRSPHSIIVSGKSDQLSSATNFLCSYGTTKSVSYFKKHNANKKQPVFFMQSVAKTIFFNVYGR